MWLKERFLRVLQELISIRHGQPRAPDPVCVVLPLAAAICSKTLTSGFCLKSLHGSRTTDFRCPPDVRFSRKRKHRQTAPSDEKGHFQTHALQQNRCKKKDRHARWSVQNPIRCFAQAAIAVDFL